MFKNQYLIAQRIFPFEFLEINPVEFNGFYIYVNSSLNISSAKNDDYEIILIGFIIDPLNPDESNSQIINKLATLCKTVSQFLKETSIFSGRYVLIFKTQNDLIMTGDACHLRQINFGFIDNEFVIGSSLKMILKALSSEPLINKQKLDFLDNKIYLNNESSWYGNETFDDRFQKLLPNHYLNLKTTEVNRIPIYSNNYVNEEQILEFACLMLRNTYSALTKRYQLIQPLTAGWDSRILLAASKSNKDSIKYYVFDKSLGKSSDVWVPNNLRKRLNLDFTCISPEEIRDDFLLKYKQEHIVPRVLPKTENIQYHYDRNYNNNVININGNCAEIARCYYGHTGMKISLDMLLVFSGYKNKIPFFENQIEKWYLTANKYSEEYGISLLDIFYWEQRLGNWGANYPFEQDIAIEEMSPFNNRSLLLSILKIDPNNRKSPNYYFFEKLVRILWNDVLLEPINPDENLFKKLKNGNAILKYLVLKTKSLF
ncbi:MAG: hypothetical protein Q8Q40_00910 [Methylococcaceae bacterium]|nr:hypothetical protein [Methylococcaceae bacterium]MDP3902519.1 hypothetical protein [Methylococcaceae bacterium]